MGQFSEHLRVINRSKQHPCFCDGTSEAFVKALMQLSKGPQYTYLIVLPSYNYNFRTWLLSFSIFTISKNWDLVQLYSTLWSYHLQFFHLGLPNTLFQRRFLNYRQIPEVIQGKNGLQNCIKWNIRRKNNYDACIFFLLKNIFSENLSQFWNFSVIWQLNICAEESVLALPS